MTGEDLSGAVRNGLERGQAIEEIENSLIGAGYDEGDVELAIQKYLPQVQLSQLPIKIPEKIIEEKVVQVKEEAKPLPIVKRPKVSSPVVEKPKIIPRVISKKEKVISPVYEIEPKVAPSIERSLSNMPKIVVTDGLSQKKIILIFLISVFVLLFAGGVLLWIFWDKITNILLQ